MKARHVTSQIQIHEERLVASGDFTNVSLDPRVYGIHVILESAFDVVAFVTLVAIKTERLSVYRFVSGEKPLFGESFAALLAGETLSFLVHYFHVLFDTRD